LTWGPYNPREFHRFEENPRPRCTVCGGVAKEVPGFFIGNILTVCLGCGKYESECICGGSYITNPRHWSVTDQLNKINRLIIGAEMEYNILLAEPDVGRPPTKARLMKAWSDLATAKERIVKIPVDTMSREQQQIRSSILSKIYNVESKLNTLEKAMFSGIQ
jgi:3-phosphoglycerate kinase